MDVETIEQQLNDMWAQRTDQSDESDPQALIRACVLNLVVCTSDRENSRKLGQVVAAVTREHPGRVIVIQAQGDADDSTLDADASIFCQLTAGGRKQVCCETVSIRARGERIAQVPSLVRPLLEPDLPVFLWWRTVLDFQNPLLDQLVDTSDRIILDSSTLSEPEKGLRELAIFLEKRIRWSAVSDLNWTRLTPWRLLLAEFFDCPSYRPYLARLDRVEIDCGLPSTGGGAAPIQALLLVGWLASRLNWQTLCKAEWKEQAMCQWELQSEGRTVLTQIRVSDRATSDLHSIRLVVEGEPSARFVTSVNTAGRHIQTDIISKGDQSCGQIVRLDDLDEGRLIAKELEILGHDELYEQALRFSARAQPGLRE